MAGTKDRDRYKERRRVDKLNIDVREQIRVDADPIAFLCEIAQGRHDATLAQRIDAAKTLANKIVPDLKSQDVSTVNENTVTHVWDFGPIAEWEGSVGNDMLGEGGDTSGFAFEGRDTPKITGVNLEPLTDVSLPVDTCLDD